MFWVILLLCIVIFLIRKRKNRRKNRVYSKRMDTKESSINKCYNSDGEEFVIQGTKDNFKIRKNNELLFTVVDGQIVSVTDKYGKYMYEVK